MDSPNPEPDDAPPADPVSTSARGWQRVQLAVLGLIGLCGVLWAGGDPAGPAWLKWLAAALAVASLALACVAIYLVGAVAHPLRARSQPAGPTGLARRLRAGVWLTYLATAALVLGTLSAWWPSPGEDTGLVEIRDVTGTTWCGELGTGPPGTVRLDTSGGPVAIPLESVAALQPATRCD